MDIILASASPRRRELLEMLGVQNMTVMPAQGEEASCEGMSPSDAVLALSRAKAEEVAQRCGEAGRSGIIIAVDTVVASERNILGKPRSEAHAAEMLRSLSGRTHKVYTGVTIIAGDRMLAAAEETAVTFRSMTEREIAAYIATGEPMDKAGAYGIQGIASLFVEKIDGDFFNVMGLPLCRLAQLLSEVGVNLI